MTPLPYRIRPKTLDKFIGQEHIIGKGTYLRKAIEKDNFTSLILWGPPGCGKTTIAYIISNVTKSYFVKFSAVTSGVEDIKRVIKEAKDRKSLYNQKTILFVDELHRFNKLQQDAFLPYVEDSTIILIGATTENPFFELNSPLLSRSRIYQLKKLTEVEIKQILTGALQEDKILKELNPKISEEAIEFIANICDGDARVALSTLEGAIFLADKNEVTPDIVKEVLPQRLLTYDKKADYHYNVISAFIKSIRGSSPDAALYYLAVMLSAGEDPRFIARRMIILASEDIGNADPMALPIAVAAAQAVEYVGLPEAQLNLAQAAVYLACSPKSNASYLGLKKAMEDVKNTRVEDVPIHLRDTHYPAAKKQLSYGKDYKYPHNYPNGYVKQQYLPNNLQNRIYYIPKEIGYEKKIKEWLKKLRETT